LEFFAELLELFDFIGPTITATGAEANEEANEDQMDEDVELSAVNAGDSESSYEDSPIQNDNGAPVSNL